jgi:hypothetical protein
VLLPTDYTTLIREWVNTLPASPKNDYLKCQIFEKFVDASTVPSHVRRERAIAKWLSNEAVNEETNLRLSTTPDETVLLPSVRFGDFVEKTRSIISQIIGDLPCDMTLGSFSGGASTSRVRTNSFAAGKYVGKAHITRACLGMFDQSDYAAWLASSPISLEIVEGADMFTVPKNALIDRVACKEPDINMFLQKGAGSQLRKALRNVGINLQDQGRNRDLARIGSKDGSLATLDLSSASDTVSFEAVFQLMPIAWFGYLNSIRSPVIVIDGERHECEMFSSMGNGFTFELESLLFYALARATAYFTGTKGVISVYGDDLIIPSGMYASFRHILFYFGFSPNDLKSFSSGPFRESCGGHYWDGEDITPFFVRRPIDRLSELILFLNNLRVWSGRGQKLFLDSDGWPLWSLLSLDVPPELKGGDFTSSGRYQLISPGNPRKRLAPVTMIKQLPEHGKYCHKLNLIESREHVPYMEESTDKIVLGICRLADSRKWTWHTCGMLFLDEEAA